MMTAGWIAPMAKHLPPSGAALRLLAIGDDVEAVLARLRPGMAVHTRAQPAAWSEDSLDAIALFDQPLTSDVLAAGWRALRAGGRLIAVLPSAQPSADWVTLLESAGYTRILVEPARDDPAGGVLVRGEKPHTTDDTLARIRVAARQDDRLIDLDHYPSRALYLLVQQTPNKPVWALREGETLTWQAVALHTESQTVNSQPNPQNPEPRTQNSSPIPTLLAFSSLAKAVAFMQPAVLAGRIRDINKVAKFSVQTARAWGLPILLNPPAALLADHPQVLITVDPSSAEQPDE